MKNRILAIAIPLIVSMISCENYVDELNDDPNQPTDAGIENIIQGVQLSNQFWQTADAARTSMVWSNQGTGSDRQYLSLNDWNNGTATQFDGTWNEAMVGTITQAQLLEDKALAIDNAATVGMAQIIQANAFGTLTSLFGDIPFTEVNDAVNFPNPAYESQSAVYEGIQLLLDNAIANLTSGNTAQIPSNDLVYGGDSDKWLALAYTLKARYYMHTGNYPAALNSASNGISSPDGDYNADYGTTFGSDFNPFYDFLVYNRAGYMSADGAYAPTLLDPTSSIYRGNAKTNEEARLNYNYIVGGGIYNDANYELNFFSQFDWGAPDGKFGTETGSPLVTYGENLLIIAEATARTSGLSDGVTAYNDYRALLNTGYSIGIDNTGYNGLAFQYDAYEDADFANGGIENQSGLTDVDALIAEILEERYVYFIGHIEAFIDLNRTDNGAEVQLKSGFSGTPERYLYPQVEINGNSSTPNPIPSVTEPTPINQ